MVLRKFLILLPLFICFTVNGQINSFYGIYDVNIKLIKPPDDLLLTEGSSKKESIFLEEMIRASNNMQIELRFDKYRSFSKPIDALDLDNNVPNLGKGLLVKMGLENELYLDYNNCTFYRKRGNDDYSHLVKINASSIDVQISNDTKKVNNIIYNRASAVTTINSTQYDVVAWFCPSIPVQFGIGFFYGLPGLITELYATHGSESKLKFSFTLTSFKSDNKVNSINIPISDFEILTEEESQKKFKSLLKKLGN